MSINNVNNFSFSKCKPSHENLFNRSNYKLQSTKSTNYTNINRTQIKDNNSRKDLQNFMSSTLSSISKSPKRTTTNNFLNKELDKIGFNKEVLLNNKEFKLEKNKSVSNLNSTISYNNTGLYNEKNNSSTYYSNWKNATKKLFSYSRSNANENNSMNIGSSNNYLSNSEESDNKNLSFRNYFLQFRKYKPAKTSVKSNSIITSYGANTYQGIYRLISKLLF